MTSLVPVSAPHLLRRRARSTEEVRVHRLWAVWALLFLDVLGYTTGDIVDLPHRVGEVITQGALVLAFVLALSVNPRIRIRPSLFLGLYSLLALMSLAMSIRFIGIGTDYRALRLILFLIVIWLTTPWWGRKDMLFLRCQLRFLILILASTALGLVISPHRALAINFGTHRLNDAFWPITATQVGHYMAELTGLLILLWVCGLMKPRLAVLLLIPSLAALLATHTRTALAGLTVGLLIATFSLFTARRRVRRVLLVTAVVAVTVVLPLTPVLTTWLERGQTGTQVSDLSGRTNVWTIVLAEPKPETNKIFGSGLSNGGVVGASDPNTNGLPIDGGWIATYQDQGIAGIVFEGAMFLVLLVTALFRPPGPARAMALFLIVYCFIASFAETGIGEASSYLLDLSLAASLLVPSWGGPQNAVGLGLS